jgi:hypothetical protein
MANGTVQSHDEFFRSCYGTLVISLLFIWLTAAAYFYLYRGLFAADELQQNLAAGTALVAFLTIIFSHDFQGGRLWGGPFMGSSDRWRRAVLPAAVVVVLTQLAMLCGLTGGSTTSPFAHYLGAIGGLTIIFARKVRTRVLIGVATVAAFWLSGRYYFPICTNVHVAVCSEPAALTADFLGFHTACIVFVIAMSIVAVTRTPPQLPE